MFLLGLMRGDLGICVLFFRDVLLMGNGWWWIGGIDIEDVFWEGFIFVLFLEIIICGLSGLVGSGLVEIFCIFDLFRGFFLKGWNLIFGRVFVGNE